jgi:radical SAM superfamily enzyme YgiQ (UPF0313 family)
VALLLHRLRDYRLYLPNPSFGNPAWEAAACRVLVLRLSPFADVQRSTPHLFLFREARAALPGAFIDLAFLPRASDATAFARAGLPLIIGTQSQRTLIDFDIVLVSNSWLLEQVNLPYLLSHSGVPVWASDRTGEWPPLILGGSNAAAAHALVSETGDCMADAMFFGEGEGSVGRIVRRWAENAGLPKRERLARIASEVRGLWIAGSLPGPMNRARAAGSPVPAQAGAPILPGPESATARLSITRGCPCLCSFCFEGHDRKPFREIPAEEVLRSARELKIATGASTLEVESFNFNTHTGIAFLLDGLARMYHRVNLMSQRVDILARTTGLLDLEIAGDKNSFTLGVEGISGRLRGFLHKSLAEDDIRRVVESAHSRKTREMKLFYMLTGRETEADIEEFAQFVKWMKQVRQSSAAAPRVVFSFGYMVRMPFTPLRHDPLILQEHAWRSIGGRVKSVCETNGFEFRMSSSWSEYAATQVLAAGGYSLHALLEQMSEAGCVTDSGLTEQARQALERWIDANGEAISAEKPLGSPFPFGFLDDEDSRRFLYGQYERAKQGLDVGYPGRPSGKQGERDAGLLREARALDELMDKKHRLRPVYVTARIPREAAGMGAPWIDAWLLRKFLAGHPAETDNILSVNGTLAAGTAMNADDLPWFGRTVAAVIAWDAARLARSLGDAAGPLGVIVQGFDPEAVRTISLRLELPGGFFPDPAQRLADFLRDAHAPVTLSRSGDTATFTASEKSLKKRMLLAGTCRTSRTGTAFDLQIGSRPFLREWLESFGERETARRAVVEILDLS